MPQLRIVLDTNVLVSALVLESRALAWLRPAWTAKDLVPLASADTSLEVTRVFRYSRFHLSDAEVEELLDDYLPWCEMVEISEPPLVPECRNPNDRPFLELALFERADALVTGDADLLALAQVFPVPIITPHELRSRLEIA